jgi:hypothetical protein
LHDARRRERRQLSAAAIRQTLKLKGEFMGHRLLWSLAATFIPLAVLMLVATSAGAQSGDPFGALKGEWKGGGTVTALGGDPVKVACKVTYDLAGDTLSQKLRCAGEDTTVKTETKMTDKGGKISGSWLEKSYDRSGGLNGTATDKTIHARISGDKFSGRMSVNLTDKGHTINIMQLDKGSGIYRQVASLALSR